MEKHQGIPFFSPPFQGEIHPKYYQPSLLKVILDIGRLMEAPDRDVILDGRNRVVGTVLPLESNRYIPVVMKEFRTSGADKLKRMFRPSKARRAWRSSNALVEKKFATPFPVAYLEKKKGLLLEQSYFLSERIHGAREIRELFRSFSSSGLRELLESLAEYLGRCHQEGILHRDLSDGNILVREDRGRREFFLIDTNRIRVKKHLSLLGKVKGLIRLGIPAAHQQYFLTKYLGKQRFNAFLWSWYRVNKAVFTWYIKAKKRLRLRQLAEKLRIQ